MYVLCSRTTMSVHSIFTAQNNSTNSSLVKSKSEQNEFYAHFKIQNNYDIVTRQNKLNRVFLMAYTVVN